MVQYQQETLDGSSLLVVKTMHDRQQVFMEYGSKGKYSTIELYFHLCIIT